MLTVRYVPTAGGIRRVPTLRVTRRMVGVGLLLALVACDQPDTGISLRIDIDPALQVTQIRVRGEGIDEAGAPVPLVDVTTPGSPGPTLSERTVLIVLGEAMNGRTISLTVEGRAGGSVVVTATAGVRVAVGQVVEVVFFLSCEQADCTDEKVCGDGEVDSPEECDDGNQALGDGCRPDCTVERCGDGLSDPGEGCDDGGTAAGDGCSPLCNPEICGNGITDPGEPCDDGNEVDTDACTSDCVLAACGDGITQPVNGEQCDDANASSTDDCLESCLAATCGDGFVRIGYEQCDDGNDIDTDVCPSTCEVAQCGDGFVHAGFEECDDGNMSEVDGCLNSCVIG